LAQLLDNWSRNRVGAGGCLGELAVVERVVEAPLDHELLVAALLDDPPWSMTMIVSALRIVESRWAITKLVRPSRRASHRLLDEHLRAGVDVAGGLVEDQDALVGEKGRARW